MKKFILILIAIIAIGMAFTTCSNKDGGIDADGIDLDMSKMSSVLVYSQVVNIYESPDDYIGKRIKINGQYFASYYDQTELYYHYVVVGDEFLCCQAGLEFFWNGKHTYPDDYPEDKTEIEVVGVFGSYEELGETYYFLTVDDISVLRYYSTN